MWHIFNWQLDFFGLLFHFFQGLPRLQGLVPLVGGGPDVPRQLLLLLLSRSLWRTVPKDAPVLPLPRALRRAQAPGRGHGRDEAGLGEAKQGRGRGRREEGGGEAGGAGVPGWWSRVMKVVARKKGKANRACSLIERIPTMQQSMCNNAAF